MLKRICIAFLILLFSTNTQIFAQTFCTNESAAASNIGQTEEYFYKKYASEKGEEESLHIALTRPADELRVKKRPLVIGVHSGGFLDFCLFQPCYLKYSENVLARNFVPQGFLTASVEYRLNSPLDFKPPRIKDEVLQGAHYKAVQDVREAIKFIFKNAEMLGVDSENVFLLGTSAGAITVLHAAYLDNDEVSKDLADKYGQLAKREKIKGVISLAGALYDLKYLEGGDKIPLMLVHGTEDNIVPPEKGYYLGMKHLTPVYGDKAVYEEALKKKIPARGYFYEYGHSYPERYRSEIFKNANDFIREYLDCGAAEKSVATGK